jgi:O-antigen/teichoic acid export membrane protein
LQAGRGAKRRRLISTAVTISTAISPEAHNFKGRALWSAIAKLMGQGASLLLKLVYLAMLARLLTPNDFGLVAMVTAFTGILDLFTTAGLSSATVQKAEITDQQISQLFWLNILVGCVLALFCLVSAHLIAAFYEDPRLFWITVVMAPGFLLNAAGVQHSALLQRNLRYVALSVIDTISQLGSTVFGISLALMGYGYWALVIAALLSPCINSVCCWIAVGWLPRWPRRGVDVRSMVRFGGIVTLNSVTVYMGYNMERVLLGRFWGAEALGLYTRALQLVNLPVGSINSAVGGVFFSTLSRLQDNPVRYRNFFLNGYSLVMAVTIPATLFSMVFAEEIVHIILGPQWADATIIFRLMTPTILVFGIINPLAWLLLSNGLQKRSLKVGLVLAPLVTAAYSIGLPYGPTGVAFCYSTVMILWLVPHVAWCLHGTPISIRDLARTIIGPLLSGLLAAAITFELRRHFGEELHPAFRLAAGGAAMIGIYGWILLVPMRYHKLYADAFAALKGATKRAA